MGNLRHVFSLLIFSWVFGSALWASQMPSCAAVVHVTVVPMDREGVLSDQTVLVRGNRIAEVGSSEQVKVPDKCMLIEGHHHYLVPGLVDSHVHLPLHDRSDQLLVLQMLLTNGITTAINMEGSAEILEVRNQIRAGKVFAPTLYTTGVFIQQPAFMSPDQVRNEVIGEKTAGYDF